MARNFFRIFTENNPVIWDSKTFCIPEAKGLSNPTKSYKIPQKKEKKEKNLLDLVIKHIIPAQLELYEITIPSNNNISFHQ